MADYTLTAKLMADAKDFIAGFDKAKDSINGTGEAIKQTSKNVAATGAKMSLAVTTPLIAAGKSIIGLGMSFDDSMSQVAAVSGATGEDLTRLRDTAKEMGATTRFSASEAADALNYMAMAGWKTDQMIGGLPGILSLAAASGADLATTSDIVTDALTAFGLTAADAGSFADVLAAASSNANTNVVMLGESFKYVAPLAGAMGYSAEDVSHALGLMANAGIKGSQAGTSLKTMLANLASPTKQMKGAMDDLGISLTNSDGTMKTLSEVMGDLRTSFADLDEQQQAAYSSTIFGKEAMAGALSIINASEADYNKLSDAIYNSEGAATKMAETMEANVGGMWRNIQSATEGVAISLYERMTPALLAAGGVILEVLSKLNNLSDGTMDMILIVAAVAAAIGPALIALGTFGIVLGGLVTVFGMLFSPIGLVIGGLAALGVAIGIAMLKSETFREIMLNVFNTAKDAVMGFVSTVVPILTSMWEISKGAVAEFASTLGDRLLVAFDTIKSIIMTVIDVVGQFVSSIISGFTSAGGQVNTLSALFLGFNPVLKIAFAVLSEFGPQIAAGFQQIASLAVPILTTLGTMLGQLAAAVIPLVMNVISTLIPIVVLLVGVFMDLISSALPIALSIFEQLVPIVMSLVTTVINLVGQLLPLVSTIISALVPVLTTLITTIMNIVKTAAPALIAVFGAVISIFQAVLPVIVAIVKGVVQMVANIISAITPIIAFVGGVISTIMAIISPIVTFVAGIIASIFEVITPITEFVAGVFSLVFDIVSTIWRSIFQFIASIISSISTSISSVMGSASVAFNSVWATVRGTMDKVSNKVQGVFTAITNAWSGLKVFVSGVFSGIEDNMRALVESVKGFVNGVIRGVNMAIGVINKIPGVNISPIPQLARGTDNWGGGLARMNEGGRGELVSLPSGTQVIPHDVSMRYAREAGRRTAAYNQHSTENNDTTYNYGGVSFNVDLDKVKDLNKVMDLFRHLDQEFKSQ